MSKIYLKYTLLLSLTIPFLFSCASLSSVAKESLKSTVHITAKLNNAVSYMDYFEEPENPEDVSESDGSGVVVKRDGNKYYIITNEHVIDDYKSIEVTLSNEHIYPATVIGYDARLDLSLLEIVADENVAVAKLGDSSKLRIGDVVFAIGSPYNYKFSLTSGIVSYLYRQRGPDSSIQDYIQTDTTINPGNSGGPLFNSHGKLIGINNWIRLAGIDKGYTNISFSIPINNVKKPIEDFLHYGEVKYRWAGFNMLSFVDLLSADMKAEKQVDGVLIPNVYIGSPAYKSGINPGDLIVAIDNRKVENSQNVSLRLALADKKLKFNILRHNKTTDKNELVNKDVEVMMRPQEEDIAKLTKDLYPGMYVLPMLYSIRREYKLDKKGVFVISVFADTPASKSDLKANDVITKVNDKKIENMRDFYDEVSQYKDLTIEYFREGETKITKILMPKPGQPLAVPTPVNTTLVNQKQPTQPATPEKPKPAEQKSPEQKSPESNPTEQKPAEPKTDSTTTPATPDATQ